MVRVKKCLNDACTEYVLVEDGRLFIQPQEKCDVKRISKNFKDEFARLIPQITSTVYISEKTLRVKEGDNIPF